jgi:hypothetical protein
MINLEVANKTQVAVQKVLKATDTGNNQLRYLPSTIFDHV